MTEFRFTPEVLGTIRRRLDIGDEDWEDCGPHRLRPGDLPQHLLEARLRVKDSRGRVPEALTGIDDRRAERSPRRRPFARPRRRGLMSDCLEIVARDRLFVALFGE